MRITSKGQVTNPIEIREQAGLMPNTEVEFDGTAVRIVPAAKAAMASRGARLVAHLRGRGDVAMTTEAIMALTRRMSDRCSHRQQRPTRPHDRGSVVGSLVGCGGGARRQHVSPGHQCDRQCRGFGALFAH
jgi:bifunctional DNA-binding transcriptional regulator/antitoxin component of YhaV-PrlF toxin-antitoxin module